jgi:hypothetical protein
MTIMYDDPLTDDYLRVLGHAKFILETLWGRAWDHFRGHFGFTLKYLPIPLITIVSVSRTQEATSITNKNCFQTRVFRSIDVGVTALSEYW